MRANKLRLCSILATLQIGAGCVSHFLLAYQGKRRLLHSASPVLARRPMLVHWQQLWNERAAGIGSTLGHSLLQKRLLLPKGANTSHRSFLDAVSGRTTCWLRRARCRAAFYAHLAFCLQARCSPAAASTPFPRCRSAPRPLGARC